jgi:hypothetical protein
MKTPIAHRDFLDEDLLAGRGWCEVTTQACQQLVKLFPSVVVKYEQLARENAMFDGIPAGAGFALGGFWACGSILRYWPMRTLSEVRPE